MSTSNTKLKITYGTAEEADGSKTFNNMNPEASTFVSLQNKQIREISRIDTTVISG